jgi:hypothetical protein
VKLETLGFDFIITDQEIVHGFLAGPVLESEDDERPVQYRSPYVPEVTTEVCDNGPKRTAADDQGPSRASVSLTGQSKKPRKSGVVDMPTRNMAGARSVVSDLPSEDSTEVIETLSAAAAAQPDLVATAPASGTGQFAGRGTDTAARGGGRDRGRGNRGRKQGAVTPEAHSAAAAVSVTIHVAPYRGRGRGGRGRGLCAGSAASTQAEDTQHHIQTCVAADSLPHTVVSAGMQSTTRTSPPKRGRNKGSVQSGGASVSHLTGIVANVQSPTEVVAAGASRRREGQLKPRQLQMTDAMACDAGLTIDE